MRLVPLAVLALLLAGCAAPAAQDAPMLDGAAPDPDAALPSAPGVHFFNVTVDGERAMGLLAVPEGGGSRVLLVYSKGYATDVGVYVPFFERLAEEGRLALAMDYRGDDMDFKIRAGVDDTIAGTLAVQRAHPEIEITFLVGGSLGGAVSGVAVAEAPEGTYDYWFDLAGTTDIAATWAQLPNLQPVIEAETGGTPLEVPAAYAERSVVLRAAELAGKGLRRAFLLYGAADTVVPIEHGERAFDALQKAGVPVSLYEVTTDRYSYACVPLGLHCGVVPAPSPAAHEVAWIGLEMPMIRNRIDGKPDPAESAVRGVYDGTTGTYAPSDVG